MTRDPRSPKHEDWISRLARSFSPLTLGIIVLATMLFYFWLSGIFFPSESPEGWLTSAQSTGVALTLSTTPAFLLAAILGIDRRSRTSLGQLRDANAIEGEAVKRVLGDSILSLSGSQNFIVTLLGIVMGSFNVPWYRVEEEFGGPLMFPALALAVGNLVTWIVVVHTLARGVRVSNALRLLGRQYTRVDLLRPDLLLPFGRVGTFNVMIAAIAVSFSSFQSLDAELRWTNYQYALAVGIPSGLTMLLLPMLGIRASVRRAKHEALERINALIADANRDLEPEPIRFLGDLLSLRDTVKQAREWPLDTTALSRIAIYFIIPPIAWVGGALVEILLDAAIG